MTLENLLTQVGIGTKQLTDRYSGDYGAPVHDQHVYYAYEPSASHGQASSKHSYGGGLKSNASMSALTLLAFLFFLHILQQCIKEHMTEMSTAPIVVMGASREGENAIAKTAKIDKTGVTEHYSENKDDINTSYNAKNPFKNAQQGNMMRIKAAEHKPKIDNRGEYVYKNVDDTDGSFPGYVSAMNDE